MAGCSPPIRELIRRGARIALEISPEWLNELGHAILAANPAIAADPVLATAISRANRANLIHFATACLGDPGAPVPPNVGAETLHMARELVRRGLDAATLEVYRTGHSLAWQGWADIAFGLTSDPDELHELLDLHSRLASDFVSATLTGISAQIQLEYDELTHEFRADRRKVVELILDGAVVSQARAEAAMGYSLDGSHTAAILWSDEPDEDRGYLDRAANAFSDAVGCPRPLIMVDGMATRWVWVKGVRTLDVDQIHQALDSAPHVYIAIGTPAPGVDGFRRSHHDALTAQRMLARLRSPQRVAVFADVHLIALFTENFCGADEFIARTLGDFASASPTLHTTVLTYMTEQCNAARAAKRLYTHRNTLLHRLEAAQRLLPRPLENTTLEVAVALKALQWRGNETGDSSQMVTEYHRSSASRHGSGRSRTAAVTPGPRLPE